MKRRDFLKKTAQAAALATVAGGTGYLFYNRDTSSYVKPIAARADYTVTRDAALPQLTLARSEDHVSALNQALDAIGGVKRFVRPGERITIKPNVGWDRTPEQAANTNPLLVGEMTRVCLEAGASKVVVTDITCNEARRCFLRSGIREAAEKAGAEVIVAGDDDFITADLGGDLLTAWPVMKSVIETDRVINMPIVKHHKLSSCTIGMKNLYGIIGGGRHRLHQEIDRSIVDLSLFCKPTLTVVDATRVLLRGGPTGGSLDDVAIENTVMCATDPVAADARGAEFIGLEGRQVGHIVLAEKSQLGQIDSNAAGYKEIA